MRKYDFLYVISVSITMLLCPCARSSSVSSSDELTQPQALPFSAQTNFMSLPGFARWQYFKQNGKWPPKIIEEVVAESPVDGGFDLSSLLRKIQPQIKLHPYAMVLRDSWHIDTIGPDWQDNYLITYIYNRSEGMLYAQQSHDLPRKGWKLTDEMIPHLLKVQKEAAVKAHSFDEGEEQMKKWWKIQKK